MTDFKQWQGLRALVNDAVEHGASAVQRVHLATARRPFSIVESIPAIGGTARTVHVVHDAIVSQVYDNIRLVNAIVGKTLEVAIEAMEDRAEDERERVNVNVKEEGNVTVKGDVNVSES